MAKGYIQEEGIDNIETFTYVARLKSLRMILAFMSIIETMLHQIRSKYAFLKWLFARDAWL